MDQFIVYNNIEIFDAAALPAGEKVSFPPPNDMWRANIISSARRRCPAGSTSNAVWCPGPEWNKVCPARGISPPLSFNVFYIFSIKFRKSPRCILQTFLSGSIGL